jgi:hypothetical protein
LPKRISGEPAFCRFAKPPAQGLGRVSITIKNVFRR